MELYPEPRTILVDFEQAVISAIGATLDNDVQVRGCFYHLTQATWRTIQELGLVPQYRDKEEFELFCGQLDAPAFLPTEDIPEGTMYIRGNTAPGAEGLVDYFDQTYVTGTFRTFRRAGVPLEQPLFWCSIGAAIVLVFHWSSHCSGVPLEQPLFWCSIGAAIVLVFHWSSHCSGVPLEQPLVWCSIGAAIVLVFHWSSHCSGVPLEQPLFV